MSEDASPINNGHTYKSFHLFKVCSYCGAAAHKWPYEGFNYWLAGVGLLVEPRCTRNPDKGALSND